MNDRSKRISELLKSQKSRTAYIKAKLSVLVPAQIRALRLKSENPPMPFQRDLARESDFHQSRISMFETPGAANITIETLAKIAAALRVGVVIKFVPFSDMLRWENTFSQDHFSVTPLSKDNAFLGVEETSEVQLASAKTANFAQTFSDFATENALESNTGQSRIRQGAFPAASMSFGADTNAIGGAA